MQEDGIRGRLWLWGHPAGSHNAQYGLSGTSRVAPAQAAAYMGLPNLLMVVYGGRPEPPFDPAAGELSSLKQVVWSIVGDASSARNEKKTDLEEVVSLADRFPNITGVIMDDFFTRGSPERIARYGVDELAGFREELLAAPRNLDLWVVLYSHDLELPVTKHLEQCDVVTFWTWRAEDLAKLETNFTRAEELTAGKRMLLGCYMWDYGAEMPMPLGLMKYQCETGLKWLNEGRIDGMIFLASCICDLGIEAVEWTRDWIRRLGGKA